jgi:hypothetical protein
MIRKMKKKIWLSLIMLIFVCSLIGPVMAQTWQLDNSQSYGSWAINYHYHWKSENDNQDAQLVYVYNLSGSNFTIWDFKVHPINIDITGLGSMAMGFEATWGNDTDWCGVAIYWHKMVWSWLFGLFQGSTCIGNVFVSKTDNYTKFEKVGELSYFTSYHFVFYRSAIDKLTIKIVALENRNSDKGVWEFSRTYNFSESIFSQIYLEQYMGKIWTSSGIRGFVDGEKTNELILADGSIYGNWTSEQILGFWDSIKSQIWNTMTSVWYGLTSWSSNAFPWLGDLGRYLWFGLTFIAGLFGVAIQFLPYLFAFYGIWLFCLCIDSVVQGSFDPLYSHFMDVYHFFANLISMIMNVAQTIWNYIKFW